MNTFLQENILAIFLFFLLTLLLMLGALFFIIVRLLLREKEHIAEEPSTKKKEEKTKKLTEKFFCENHPTVSPSGGCLVCEDVFCEKCLVEHDGLYFCHEHFHTFSSHRWVQITDVKTTPDTPLDGLFVYDFKRSLWQKEKIPTFVITHYKINIEDDFIESFIQLNVREEDVKRLSMEIKNFKA